MSARRKMQLYKGCFSKFPTQRNREFQRPNREFFAPIRELSGSSREAVRSHTFAIAGTRLLPETSSIPLVQRRSLLAAPEAIQVRLWQFDKLGPRRRQPTADCGCS